MATSAEIVRRLGAIIEDHADEITQYELETLQLAIKELGPAETTRDKAFYYIFGGLMASAGIGCFLVDVGHFWVNVLFGLAGVLALLTSFVSIKLATVGKWVGEK